MKSIIKQFSVGGFKNPRISIQGFLYGNEKIIIKVDNKEIKYEDINYLGHDLVFKDIVKNGRFNYGANIDKNAKIIEIVIKSGKKEELVITKKMKLLNKLIERFNYRFVNIRLSFVYLLKSLKRTLKRSYQKNKFKISKNIIKENYKYFRYQFGRRAIEQLYYFPEYQKDYLKWIEENKKIIEYKELKYKPLISILIPVYNVEPNYLKECIDSILNQSYTNFEICIADDCSTSKDTKEVLEHYKNNEKIRIVYRPVNGHISQATNSALDIAKGEYIGLVDNDDVLAKDALYEVVCALNDNKKLDMIYSDEDKISLNGKRTLPNFKPDYSPDTLLSMNYICHFTVLRKKIVDEIGGFRSKYDGAQDYDLFLRFVEKTNNIYHISKILYHWRCSKTSTSLNYNNKDYTMERGRLAIVDALKRRNIKADVILKEDIGRYIIDYKLDKEPKVSIIIPTKDRSEVLDKCLKSIYEKTDYTNYEVIVIDNNSSEKSLFDLLNEYKDKYSNFNSYRYECEFNYSYLNNEGVKHSKGDYIVLLNNDTEVITSSWLKTMVGYAKQEHIGCVGIKLLYPNNNIQHAGVVVGMGGVASHIYLNTPEFESGYYDRLQVPYDVKMVTAACLMIKRTIFDEVNGLDENLKVAYNDVDLNVRVRDKGYYNIILPQVLMHHYESLSRGSDLESDKLEKFKQSINYIVNKLGTSLEHDEFYNDNLAKDYWFVLDRKDNHE